MQAQTLVEKKNIEINQLYEELKQVRIDKERERDEFQKMLCEKATQDGVTMYELEKKIRILGEVQFIVDEKNAI